MISRFTEEYKYEREEHTQGAQIDFNLPQCPRMDLNEKHNTIWGF
jgi:hypothetical protein